MIEYKVRRIDSEGTGEIERICNEHARDGWRLVTASVSRAAQFDTVVFLFFERAAPER